MTTNHAIGALRIYIKALFLIGGSVVVVIWALIVIMGKIILSTIEQ